MSDMLQQIYYCVLFYSSAPKDDDNEGSSEELSHSPEGGTLGISTGNQHISVAVIFIVKVLLHLPNDCFTDSPDRSAGESTASITSSCSETTTTISSTVAPTTSTVTTTTSAIVVPTAGSNLSNVSGTSSKCAKKKLGSTSLTQSKYIYTVTICSKLFYIYI